MIEGPNPLGEGRCCTFRDSFKPTFTRVNKINSREQALQERFTTVTGIQKG